MLRWALLQNICLPSPERGEDSVGAGLLTNLEGNSRKSVSTKGWFSPINKHGVSIAEDREKRRSSEELEDAGRMRQGQHRAGPTPELCLELLGEADYQKKRRSLLVESGNMDLS